MKLSVKKLAAIANERKSKVVNDFVSHRGSNIRVGWIKINFSKFDPKQKQTNVGHFVTDEIINCNSKKMCYNVKKVAVSVFERKLKVIYDLIQKNYVDRFLKSTENFYNVLCSAHGQVA